MGAATLPFAMFGPLGWVAVGSHVEAERVTWNCWKPILHDDENNEESEGKFLRTIATAGTAAAGAIGAGATAAGTTAAAVETAAAAAEVGAVAATQAAAPFLAALGPVGWTLIGAETDHHNHHISWNCWKPIFHEFQNDSTSKMF